MRRNIFYIENGCGRPAAFTARFDSSSPAWGCRYGLGDGAEKGVVPKGLLGDGNAGGGGLLLI